MNIERDQDFEQSEDTAAVMTESPGIEFENGKYVYYGLDGRTAFAAVYISGAWMAWQAAKAEAVHEGFVLVPKEPTQEMLLKIESPSGFNFEVPCGHENAGIDAETASEIYKAMIKAAKSQAVPENKQFDLDEFLIMEEKLKSKGGIIKADLDRFIAYAEMVLEKAKALKEPK